MLQQWLDTGKAVTTDVPQGSPMESDAALLIDRQVITMSELEAGVDLESIEHIKAAREVIRSRLSTLVTIAQGAPQTESELLWAQFSKTLEAAGDDAGVNTAYIQDSLDHIYRYVFLPFEQEVFLEENFQRLLSRFITWKVSEKKSIPLKTYQVINLKSVNTFLERLNRNIQATADLWPMKI